MRRLIAVGGALAVKETEFVERLKALGYKGVGIKQPSLMNLARDLAGLSLPIKDLELQDPRDFCIMLTRPLTAQEAWRAGLYFSEAGEADYMENVDGECYIGVHWDFKTKRK